MGGARPKRGAYCIPKIDLPPDHRLLMQAIMALAELTTGELQSTLARRRRSLASAIHEELTSKGLNPEFIARTIRTANGLDGLCSLYLSFGNTSAVSRNVRANLASGMMPPTLVGFPPRGSDPSGRTRPCMVTAAHPVAA